MRDASNFTLSRRSFMSGLAAGGMAVAGGAVSRPAAAEDQAGLAAAARPGNLNEIVEWDALTLSKAIKSRTVSCVEVMTAYLDQIDRCNPKVNAIVMLRDRSEALAEAAAKDDMLKNGQHMGWMHGFPQAIKDLADCKGFKTTRGFFRPPFDTTSAEGDSMFVQRMRAAGSIFIGKTNTPVFGLGSNTYNGVFGITGNAWNPEVAAGGSSGGAAVAVALRMLPVADGSDFFGSLRNPPGWNNVYGLRPSFGRIPSDGAEQFVQQGSALGPIARNPADLAMLFATMSGYDARAPLSISEDPAVFRTLAGAVKGKKVAWMANLGGYLPMEPEVLAVTSKAVAGFEDLGVGVTKVDALPAFGAFKGNESLWPTWLIYRHWLVGGGLKALYDNETYRPHMKPEAIYEVEGLIKGADGNPALTGADTFRGSVLRTAMYQAFRTLFNTYDYVVLPTAQLFPFPAKTHWPSEINGVAMSSYHRWMEVTSIGTLLNAPTVAIPAGFSAAGLPIGLQVIGRNHDDLGVLNLAAAWDAKTKPYASRRSPLLGS